MRQWFWMVVFAGLALGTLAEEARASGTSTCENNQPWTYQAQPGDVSLPTRLEVKRQTAGVHTLHLTVCSGELHIVRGERNSGLHMEVTARGTGKPLASFLQAFSADDGQATVTLQLPKDAHAVITLAVPGEVADATNEVNLGEGTLRLEQGALLGRREVNLGAGSAYVVLDADRDYQTLETNVGLGRLSDERPGGHGGLFVVSRSSAGSGSGTLAINVGAGTLHLLPEHTH